MRGTVNPNTGGQYCGRAARGVSNLSTAHLREIEAHRAKERPTPWSHLALRYGVNEIDLRALLSANDQGASTEPAPLDPVASLPGLWAAGLSCIQIAKILEIDERSVQRMRKRLNLPTRTRADL